MYDRRAETAVKGIILVSIVVVFVIIFITSFPSITGIEVLKGFSRLCGRGSG